MTTITRPLSSYDAPEETDRNDEEARITYDPPACYSLIKDTIRLVLCAPVVLQQTEEGETSRVLPRLLPFNIQ